MKCELTVVIVMNIIFEDSDLNGVQDQMDTDSDSTLSNTDNGGSHSPGSMHTSPYEAGESTTVVVDSVHNGRDDSGIPESDARTGLSATALGIPSSTSNTLNESRHSFQCDAYRNPSSDILLNDLRIPVVTGMKDLITTVLS
jgi:hypothetical protein